MPNAHVRHFTLSCTALDGLLASESHSLANMSFILETSRQSSIVVVTSHWSYLRGWGLWLGAASMQQQSQASGRKVWWRGEPPA